MTIITTLKALRQNEACYSGYNKVVRMLQDKPFMEEDQERESYIRFKHDALIPLSAILENNGLDDALWALRACEQTRELIRAERLFAVWCVRQVCHLMTDHRNLNALDVAERHAHGEATDKELAAARAAAWDAARAAAWDAAWDAAWAAAWAAARDADWDAARDVQRQKFIEVFCGDAINIDALKATEVAA